MKDFVQFWILNFFLDFFCEYLEQVASLNNLFSGFIPKNTTRLCHFFRSMVVQFHRWQFFFVYLSVWCYATTSRGPKPSSLGPRPCTSKTTKNGCRPNYSHVTIHWEQFPPSKLSAGTFLTLLGIVNQHKNIHKIHFVVGQPSIVWRHFDSSSPLWFCSPDFFVDPF
jgi:hypothetical protein